MLSLFSLAAATCFEAHVREAVEQNTARRAAWSALSAGLTEPLTDRLVAIERATLPVARAYDRRAAPFRRAGIPVLCDEFVPMSGAGEVDRGAVPGPPPPWPEASAMVVSFERAWSSDGFAGAAGWAEEQVAAMPDPDYLCMTRHLLESVRRAAQLAPRHHAQALAAGFRWRDPRRLSREFAWMQVAALPAALDLDRDAAPIQASGVPFLCRDLPPVPPV